MKKRWIHVSYHFISEYKNKSDWFYGKGKSRTSSKIDKYIIHTIYFRFLGIFIEFSKIERDK